ncbi:MAG: D-alanine--D-alanine ligase [Actinomycetota bacterium]|nr:D-alanine--D-alanine ligase [Actinomycetota bacterium]
MFGTARTMQRLSVGVIFGGRSVEHDVSIVTAHQAMAQLSERHDVVPIYVTREGRWLTSPALNDLDVYRQRRWEHVGEEAFIPPTTGYGGLHVPGARLRRGRTVPIDVVVPAVHGTYGEDGTLQGLLDLAGIPYAGSGVLASALGMDKVMMKAVFRAAGLPVVPHVLAEESMLAADEGRVIDQIEAGVGYPAFVKPARLGSSVGIARATERRALVEALGIARRYDRRVLVEPAMDGCIEVNCSVLGGAGVEARVSVCEQPVAWEEFLTFSDKYLRGAKGAKQPAGMAAQDRRIPAPISETLTKQVQDNALKAFAALGASGVARIDSFVKEETGECWVMEINTLPGSFSFYLWEATGTSFGELLQVLIEIALAEHRAKSELLVGFDSGILEAPMKGKPGG